MLAVNASSRLGASAYRQWPGTVPCVYFHLDNIDIHHRTAEAGRSSAAAGGYTSSHDD